MNVSALGGRLCRAWQRRLARRLGRRTFSMPAGRPLVSFTFDDFPRSALAAGGSILEAAGAAGTFYTSLGLCGKRTATGDQFTHEDLESLLQSSHEIGCHTFHHCHSWETPAAVFEDSVIRNADTLRALSSSARFESLSYPLSYPRPDTKRRVSRHMATSRGGGQTFNVGTIDLNYLSAFFIEQSRDDVSAIERMIDANAAAGGWLILATHDISDAPTDFGCTPALFTRIVRRCVESGAQLATVSAAWFALQARAGARSSHAQAMASVS